MSPQSASTISEVPARQQHPFRLLDLPDVILKVVIDYVVECDIEEAVAHSQAARSCRALMSLSLVNRQLRLNVRSRILRTVCLLRRRDRVAPDTIQKFAAVAQGSPHALSEEVMDIFCRPPAHLFAGTSSLAIHQFWTRGYHSDVWISKGIIKLLQAPRSLRRLHIDGDTKLANYMEAAMETLPAIDFSTLTEVTISIEMAFLLKYMPNIQRLSNKAFSGISFSPRVYPMSHVREFLDACRNRPKLNALELTVADFDPYRRKDFHNASMFQIPALSLETFAITGEAPRTMLGIPKLRMPIGGIINMALSQPGLVELQIPWETGVTLGLDEADDWEDETDPSHCIRELIDMRLAAVIAAKVPGIKRVKVGRRSMIEIVRDQDQVKLKLSDILIPRLYSHQTVSWYEFWDDWKEPAKNRPTFYSRGNQDVVLPLQMVHEGPDVHPCVLDKVVECDIEDGVENGVWRPVDSDDGISEPPRPHRALVSLSQVNKQLRRLAKPRLFGTVRVLRRGHGGGKFCFSRDAFQHNAPLVVGRRPAPLPTRGCGGRRRRRCHRRETRSCAGSQSAGNIDVTIDAMINDEGVNLSDEQRESLLVILENVAHSPSNAAIEAIKVMKKSHQPSASFASTKTFATTDSNMDDLSSRMQGCHLQPFPLMKLPNELIRGVLEQLLDTSDRYDPSCGKSALIAFSKASWQARKLAERIIFRDITLISGGQVSSSWSNYSNYSYLARYRPTMDSPGLQTLLVRAPPDFLRHIQSLSIHQFWDVDSVSTDYCLEQIAQGISRLLLKPTTLRRLEIDAGDLLAQKVEGCLQQNGAAQSVYLKQLILSVEFCFLLKLTPKATRVSNSTREGYGKSSVLYTQVETLSIFSTRLVHPENDGDHEPRIPMGLILEMIASQPTIYKVTIPYAHTIDTGVTDRAGWSSIVGCHNWGPAAVIAVRFANIKDISVGFHFDLAIGRDSDKGKVFLKGLTGWGNGQEVTELEVKVVTASDEGCADHEEDAAWIVFESDGGAEEKPTCVVVNADSEAIDEIEEFPVAKNISVLNDEDRVAYNFAVKRNLDKGKIFPQHLDSVRSMTVYQGLEVKIFPEGNDQVEDPEKVAAWMVCKKVQVTIETAQVWHSVQVNAHVTGASDTNTTWEEDQLVYIGVYPDYPALEEIDEV
ncbi:hypothetical protein BKA80DRAFT_256281 [Phyllosticta citrichinensis]